MTMNRNSLVLSFVVCVVALCLPVLCTVITVPAGTVVPLAGPQTFTGVVLSDAGSILQVTGALTVVGSITGAGSITCATLDGSMSDTSAFTGTITVSGSCTFGVVSGGTVTCATATATTVKGSASLTGSTSSTVTNVLESAGVGGAGGATISGTVSTIGVVVVKALTSTAVVNQPLSAKIVAVAAGVDAQTGVSITGVGSIEGVFRGTGVVISGTVTFTTGGVTLTGGSIGGSPTFQSAVSLSGSSITGTPTFANGVTVSNGMTISGTLTSSTSAVTVSGSITGAGSIVANSLVVTSAVTSGFTGTITVSGSCTFGVVSGGTVTCATATATDITGSASLTGTTSLNVVNILNSAFASSPSATITGSVSSSQSLNFGSVTLASSAQINQPSGGQFVSTVGINAPAGASIIGAGTVVGPLTGTSVSIGGTVTCTGGTFTLTSSTITAGVTMLAQAVLNSSTATGNAVFRATTTVNGGTISGAAAFQASTTVTGAVVRDIPVFGTASFVDVDFNTGSITTAQTQLSGTSIIRAGTTINSGVLNASGTLTIDGSLSSSSVGTLAGTITGAGSISASSSLDCTNLTSNTATLSSPQLITFSTPLSSTFNASARDISGGSFSGNIVLTASSSAVSIGSLSGNVQLTSPTVAANTVSGAVSIVASSSISVDTIASSPTLNTPALNVRVLSGVVNLVNPATTVTFAPNGRLNIDSINNWSSATVVFGSNTVVQYFLSMPNNVLLAKQFTGSPQVQVSTTTSVSGTSQCLPVLRGIDTINTLSTPVPYSVALRDVMNVPQLYIGYTLNQVQLVGPLLYTAVLPAIRIPEGSIDKLNTRLDAVVATVSFCVDYRLNINALIDYGTERQLINGIVTRSTTTSPVSVRSQHTFTGDLANGPSTSTFTVTLYGDLNSGSIVDRRVFTGTITVDNVIPTIQIASTSSVATVSGDVYSLSLLSVTDPGNDVVTAFTVRWGDNTQTSVTCGGACVFPRLLNHTYPQLPRDRTYSITVDLLDNDGLWPSVGTLSVVQKARVNLAPVTPVATLPPPPPPPVAIPPTVVPVSQPPPPTPTSPSMAPTTSQSIGTTVTVNGVSLTYSLNGQFSEFVSSASSLKMQVTSLAGRNVQLVVSNVKCGLSAVAGSLYSNQVRLSPSNGSGVLDITQIDGGQLLSICAQKTDGTWARFADVSLQTIAVTSIRYDAPLTATTSTRQQRETNKVVLIPRQQGVSAVSLRATPTMQVGDSFAFASNAEDCGSGPSATATDATVVGSVKLDFSQIPSETLVSPCIKKAGYNAWTYFPNQKAGVIEAGTAEYVPEPVLSSSEANINQQPMIVVLMVVFVSIIGMSLF